MLGNTEIEVGDIIEWCDEQFEVLDVDGFGSGTVKYVSDPMNIDKIRNFKFDYCGEKSKIIKKHTTQKVE